MSQKPVFVEPGRHFGPTTAYGKATERNCRLSIREIDMEITAVIVTTRVIKRHEFITLYYGMEYWRMILHLYVIPDDIRAGIEYALAHDQLKCWPVFPIQDSDISDDDADSDAQGFFDVSLIILFWFCT